MILAGQWHLPERPRERVDHRASNVARRCSHPHCRTTLGEFPVECPHDLPFCNYCIWEEVCAECGSA